MSGLLGWGKTKRLGLIENIFWGISGEIFVRLIKFFQFIIIAKFLGAEGLGIYNYGLAVVASLSIFFDFGILIIATKNNSKNKSPANLAPYFLLKIFTSAVGILVFCFANKIGILIADPEGVLILIVISMLILDFANLILAKYRAEHNFQKEAKFRAVVIILHILVSIALLNMGANLKQLVYCLIVINFFCVYPLLHLLWNSYRVENLWISYHKMIKLFRQCIPLAGISLFGALYTSADVLFLGFYFDAVTVGIYTVAMKFILGIIITPVTFIQNAQIPNLAELAGEEWSQNKEIIKSWRKAFFNTLFFGIFICLFFAIFAEFIILLTFGSNFESSANLLSILTIVGLLYYIYTPFMTLLIIKDNARYAFITQLICSLINIVILSLLIPRFGIIGAAVASIISHLIIFIIIVPITISLNKNLLYRKDIASIILSFVIYSLVIGLMYLVDVFAQGSEIIFKLFLAILLMILFRRRFIDLSTDIKFFIKTKLVAQSKSY